MTDRRCGTCHWFHVPASWRGVKWNHTDTQQGLCEAPTPDIPKSINWHRSQAVGAEWLECPTWRAR